MIPLIISPAARPDARRKRRVRTQSRGRDPTFLARLGQILHFKSGMADVDKSQIILLILVDVQTFSSLSSRLTLWDWKK